MGWPNVVGEKCTTAWSFLVDAFSYHDWLSRFFVHHEEYELGLRAYKVIASFLEFTNLVATGRPVAAKGDRSTYRQCF